MTRGGDDVQWGNDRTSFDGYCLRDAEAVVRVLVPASVDDTDSEVSWRDVLLEYHGELPLDGYTSWWDITELPGDGSFAPSRVYQPAAGALSEQFCARLRQALPDWIRDQQWHAKRHDVLFATEVVLAPPPLGVGDLTPSLEATGGSGGENAAGVGPPVVPAVVTGTLAELMAAWCRVGFPRWAWSSDGRVGIAAPPYADSLIVSGIADTVVPLTTSGLEAFPVSRHRPLPPMTS